MNDAVIEFIEYLIHTKNYSSHTATAYEGDIRDFLGFYQDFLGAPPFPRDLSRADTLCFRSYLANRHDVGICKGQALLCLGHSVMHGGSGGAVASSMLGVLQKPR